MYVSLDSLQSIAIYRIDLANGDLTRVQTVAVPGQPGSLTVDPTSRFLHAAIRTANSVSSFRINEENGDLSYLGTINVHWNPVYLSMDRSGRFLFAAYFSDNRAGIYAVQESGAVKSGALQVINTDKNPHSILTDGSNRFLFIPCRTGEVVLQYKFNASSGALAANEPDRISTPDSTGPRHISFHPLSHTMYAANEYGRSVTAYRIDTSLGTLSPMQTLTMQPRSPYGNVIAANTGGADVHATPNGRFLYATNRGPDSIAAYRLDPATGVMTSIAQYPTEKMPRSFAIDPDGKFLYVGGQASGKISAYQIDSASGLLRYVKSYQIGSNPVWILITRTGTQSSEVGENINGSGRTFSLSQNYPNPFNADTQISYVLPSAAHTTLRVFDLNGRCVAMLVDRFQTAGLYRISLHTGDHASGVAASGVYFYSLESEGYRQTRNMVLLR
ncbi:MAG: beta-propeller fold lactonase family protein [Ignavibacteriales bacterium]|nr:beta-propeller fold lactonase family protein [Ignavibacteriales bacterium]